MDVFATDIDFTNFMKTGSDYDGSLSIMNEFITKVQNSKSTLCRVIQSCDICVKIKAMIKPESTVEDIKNVCQQYKSQEWVDQFKETLPNCTASLTTTKLDIDKTYASLTACYDKAFFRLFGIPMLANSVYSLIQSYKIWRLIESFIIPAYESRIKSTNEQLNECATLCKPMIDLEILDQDQVKQLKRVQELLKDIKNTITFITEDVTNKIAEAKRLRSNSYVSFVMNAIATFINGFIVNKVESTIGDDSSSGAVMKLSTIIQAGCTLGDLIHAGKANLLIEQLEKQLDIMKQLEAEHERLSREYAKLSTIPVQL
jgi:hypothetical protein